MTREQEAVMRKVHHARESLARKYGNLYGIKLNRWFVFNGETAVIVGDDKSARKANLERFEERLAILQNSKGVSALHRARRAAA